MIMPVLQLKMRSAISKSKSAHLVDIRMAKLKFRPARMGLLQDWNCNDQTSGAKWR